MLKKFLVYLITIVTVITMVDIDGRALYAFKLTGRDAQYFQEVLDYVDEQVANDGGTGNKMLGDISTQLGYTENAAQVEKQLFATLESGEYIFNIHVYEGLSSEDRKETMESFLKAVNARNFSVDAKQKLSYALQEVNDGKVRSIVGKITEGTKADIVGATAWIGDYIPYIRVALGVLVIIGAITFLFKIIIDLLYIHLTILQKIWPPHEEKGFKLVSRTARAVVINREKAFNNGDIVNGVVEYFKRQGLFCIVYLVILSVLATGGFSEIFVKLLTMF